MDADRGAVDHLQIAIVSGRNSREDAIPDAEFAPPDEAVVAGRCWPVALRDIGPWRAGAQTPIDAVSTLRSSARGTPRGSFGSSGSMIDHSKSLNSYRRALIQAPPQGT
jgi:hypothetical protein